MAQHLEGVDALGSVGMADRRQARLGSLSGGQTQRVGIAQAIAGRPPVVILDEPSAGLDPAQRVQMRAALLALDSSLIVMSTHLIEEVVLVAESVVVVDRGRIIHQGPTKDLAPDITRDRELRPAAPAGVSLAEAAYLDLLGRDGNRP